MRIAVALLILGLLTGLVPEQTGSEVALSAPAGAATGAALAVGTKLSLENLARLWPDVARHWSNFGEALVLREFKGLPLRGDARLFTIVPVDAPTPNLFAMGAEFGGRIELLYFSRVGGVPLSAADEEMLDECDLCGEELAEAYYLIKKKMIDPTVKQCELPAEQMARFAAYVGSQLHGFRSPYALLLSPKEIASDQESWFPKQGRDALRKYAVEPRYLPYGFLWEENCVLEFRTADGLGGLVDWRADLPATVWYKLAKLELMVRHGVWSIKPTVYDYGPIREK